MSRIGLLSFLLFINILLSSVASLGSEFVSENFQPQNEGTDDEPQSGDTPFKINGDSEFDAMVSSEGWTGSGTSSNPYLIDGYDFNGSGHAICIEIISVSYYFVIANNMVNRTDMNSGFYSSSLGIRLENVTCRVTNNTFGNVSVSGLLFIRSNLVVDNNTFHSPFYGIYGAQSTSRIENNTIHSSAGVSLTEGSASIIDNKINRKQTAGGGISISDQTTTIIARNEITGHSRGMSVNADSSKAMKTSIINNTIANCTRGIWSWDARNITIESNTIKGVDEGDPKQRGMYLSVINLTCKNNSLFRCGINIQYLRSIEGETWPDALYDTSNTIGSVPILLVKDRADLAVTGNYSQVIFYNCSNASARSQTFSGSFFGLLAIASWDVVIKNNTVRSTMDNIVQIIYAGNPRIIDNHFGNGTAVSVLYADNGTVSKNTFENSTLLIGMNDDIRVSNNTFINITSSGVIHLRSNDIARIEDNNLTFVKDRTYTSGIYVETNRKLTFRRNEIWYGGGFVFTEFEYDYNKNNVDLDLSNKVNGKSVLYIYDTDDLNITTDYAQVILERCVNVRIEGISINDSTYGIQTYYCSNISVLNCTFTNTLYFAMLIYSYDYINIIGNRITGGDGRVWAASSDDKMIKDNVVRDIRITDAAPFTHALTVGGYATIENNVIVNVTGSGLGLGGSNNLVRYNHFENCSFFAISNEGSRTQIYLNNFYNNAGWTDPGSGYVFPQCRDGQGASWDNGTLGNYWSDYRGRYPDASNDGRVWNESYTLPGYANKQDYHPLVFPYDTIGPVIPPMDNITIDQHQIAQFNSTAYDNVGIVYSRWTFQYAGYNISLVGRNRSFLFHEAGEYNITLTVWDLWNHTTRAGLVVSVRDIESPIISGIVNFTVPQDTLVRFDTSRCSDNVGIVDIKWSFTYDDRQIGLNDTPSSFLFEIPGEYEISLNLSDAAGNWNSTTLFLTVLDTQPPVPNIGTDIEIGQGTNLLLSGINSTDNVGIVRYKWYMSSNVIAAITLEGMEFQYIFNLPGHYNITLNVTDAAGNSAASTIKVKVIDIEPPVALAGEDITVEPGTEVHLNGSGSTDNVGIVGWSWTFTYNGRMREFNTPSFTFKFDIEGQYLVNLTVRDAQGNEGHVEILVRVQDTIPPVAVAGEDQSADQHDSVTFDGSGSSDDRAIAEWSWTFEYGGEVMTLEGSTPYFIFHEAGIYHVTLKVADAAGNTAQTMMNVTVLDTESPVASAGEDTLVRPNIRITLDATGSTDNVGIVSWDWYFWYNGEETYLEGEIATFVFHIPGDYLIELTVTDARGNSATDGLIVHVGDDISPVCDAGDDVEIDQHQQVNFDGSGSSDNFGIEVWVWTFEYGGEIVRLEGQTKNFTFREPGKYDVTLKVTDAMGNSAIDIITVTVHDIIVPIASIETKPPNLTTVVGTTFTFDGTNSTDNVAIVDWAWNLTHQGESRRFDGPEFQFEFTKEGEYVMELVVTDGEGNSGSEQITIVVEADDRPIPEGGINLLVWAGIAVVITVIAVIAIVYVNRKRPSE